MMRALRVGEYIMKIERDLMRFIFVLMTFILSVSISTAESREVVDSMGRHITIPDELKRIVVMSEPAVGIPLMELGVQPVGSYGRADDGTYQLGADFVDTVLGPGHQKPKGIGLGAQTDLEKLHALKPDIIIGIEFDIDKADQLSTVAPVYLMKFLDTSNHDFSIAQDLAKLTGRETAFQQLKDTYNKRVEETKALIKDDTSKKTYLAVMVSDKLNVIGASTGVTQALEDVGYKRYQFGANNAKDNDAQKLLLQLNAESFGTVNPDVLVVVNGWGNKDRGADAARAALDKVVPSWQQYMQPAKEKRVVFVDAAQVLTPSFASAEYMLDALNDWAKQAK